MIHGAWYAGPISFLSEVVSGSLLGAFWIAGGRKAGTSRLAQTPPWRGGQ